MEALDRAGITQGVTHMAVAGGATRSPLWLQMHSDVTGLPVVVGEFDNAPLLGAAMLAAVGAGAFDDNDETRASPSSSPSSVIGAETRASPSTSTSASSASETRASSVTGTESGAETSSGVGDGSVLLLRRMQRAAKAMVTPLCLVTIYIHHQLN